MNTQLDNIIFDNNNRKQSSFIKISNMKCKNIKRISIMNFPYISTFKVQNSNSAPNGYKCKITKIRLKYDQS